MIFRDIRDLREEKWLQKKEEYTCSNALKYSPHTSYKVSFPYFVMPFKNWIVVNVWYKKRLALSNYVIS